jgi:hypothetical protein
MRKDSLTRSRSLLYPHWQWHRLLMLALAALLLDTAPVRAQTVSDIEQGLQSALDQIASGVVALSQGDSAAATAELSEASTVIDHALLLAKDPAIKAELGKKASKLRRKVRALRKKVRRAQRAANSPKARFRKQIKTLKAAYSSGMKAASSLSPLVFAEEGNKGAGFHKPGDLVTFRARSADGTACTDVPTITVQNQGFPDVVDVNTVVSNADGTFTITMGSDQGGALVSVTACGRSSTLLLYNYGPKLPAGFPPNLPLASYAMSVRVTGDVDIPETSLGTITIVNIRDFVDQLTSMLEEAVELYKVPGCSTKIEYSRFNGRAFSVRLGLSCRIGVRSASITMILKIQKI